MVRIKYKQLGNKYVSNWILCKTFYVKVELCMLVYKIYTANGDILVEGLSHSDTAMRKQVRQDLVDLGVEFIEEIRKRK